MYALFCCIHFVVVTHSSCALKERKKKRISTKIFYSIYEEVYQMLKFVFMRLRSTL